MAKKQNKKKKKSPPCEQCDALCCRYVAIEIDEPSDEHDYENIRWYLLHNNVKVFTNYEDDWFVEFVTDCSRLGEDKRCTGYETRPSLCREHGEGGADCEHMDNPYNLVFETAEEFEAHWREKT